MKSVDWIWKLGTILKLISKDSQELMTCLNLFHEKLDYNTGVQSMNSDHLEELELVMNEFTKVRNIWFLSPLVLSNWEKLALLSLYTFWGKSVYFSIFEWHISQLCQTKHK